MGFNNRDNKFGNRGGFGGGSRGGFGGNRGGFGDRGPRQMHKATCDNCNSECEVPFRPTGERPVLCRDCFGSSERPASRGGFDRNPHGTRVSFGEKPMFKADCAKCGETCEVPFRPSGDRPVFCKACFAKEGGNNRGGNNEELKAQLDAISAKLDRLLKAVGAEAPKAEKAAEKKPSVVAPMEDVALEVDEPEKAVEPVKAKKAAKKPAAKAEKKPAAKKAAKKK